MSKELNTHIRIESEDTGHVVTPIDQEKFLKKLYDDCAAASNEQDFTSIQAKIKVLKEKSYNINQPIVVTNEGAKDLPFLAIAYMAIKEDALKTVLYKEPKKKSHSSSKGKDKEESLIPLTGKEKERAIEGIIATRRKIAQELATIPNIDVHACLIASIMVSEDDNDPDNPVKIPELINFFKILDKSKGAWKLLSGSDNAYDEMKKVLVEVLGVNPEKLYESYIKALVEKTKNDSLVKKGKALTEIEVKKFILDEYKIDIDKDKFVSPTKNQAEQASPNGLKKYSDSVVRKATPPNLRTSKSTLSGSGTLKSGSNFKNIKVNEMVSDTSPQIEGKAHSARDASPERIHTRQRSISDAVVVISIAGSLAKESSSSSENLTALELTPSRTSSSSDDMVKSAKFDVSSSPISGVKHEGSFIFMKRSSFDSSSDSSPKSSGSFTPEDEKDAITTHRSKGLLTKTETKHRLPLKFREDAPLVDSSPTSSDEKVNLNKSTSPVMRERSATLTERPYAERLRATRYNNKDVAGKILVEKDRQAILASVRNEFEEKAPDSEKPKPEEKEPGFEEKLIANRAKAKIEKALEAQLGKLSSAPKK